MTGADYLATRRASGTASGEHCRARNQAIRAGHKSNSKRPDRGRISEERHAQIAGSDRLRLAQRPRS
jgi:hypothetical protein